MTHAPAPAPPDGAAPRRGRPGYDRETLLAVCVEVFNVHGYDATSMGTLSKHLGISKSAIYHHVESRRRSSSRRWAGPSTRSRRSWPPPSGRRPRRSSGSSR